MSRIEELYRRYLDGSISDLEKQELSKLLDNADETELAELADIFIGKDAPHDLRHLQFDADRILEKIKLKIVAPETETKIQPLWRYWLHVAAIAAILALSFFLYRYGHKEMEPPKEYAATELKDLAPGGKRATLTLADGRTIQLDNANAGKLAIVEGTTISKTADGQLTYVMSNDSEKTELQSSTNTISIPRGGEYQLILPDGTRVWLNAQTTIKYPTRFNGAERRVSVNGEAYFEVTKDAEHPFIVETDKQEIKVLGTHFNVNTYNTGKTVTTLAEGSVKVSSSEGSKFLKPGQQSILFDGSLEVENADMESALAWKNGLLFFRDAPLQTVLAEVSRWYDVDVQYNGKPTQELFTGSVSRASNLSAMLRILQLTGVKTKLVAEGNSRKLIIEQ
ncbi:FecR domain-containing protein [Fluviicola sp.]|uniref:FecR family protein n=1 Tax=Fluviicola sp. TaxID=1917219 RepID=UPI0031DE90C6